MNALISSLVEKADLSEEQANKAAEVVRGFLENRLPEAIKGPALAALTGENVDNLADKAKSMLGGFLK